MGTLREQLNDVLRRAELEILSLFATSMKSEIEGRLGIKIHGDFAPPGQAGQVNGAAAGLAAATPSARGRREKRSPDDLLDLEQKFLAFVTKSPGLRIEQINKDLGTTTKELTLPIRKLLARGDVRTEGEKRATSYFAAQAGSEKMAAKSTPKGKGKGSGKGKGKGRGKGKGKKKAAKAKS